MTQRPLSVDQAALYSARVGRRADGHDRGQPNCGNRGIDAKGLSCGCCGGPCAIEDGVLLWGCICPEVPDDNRCHNCARKACHCRCSKRED